MEMKSTKYPFVYVVGDVSGLVYEGKPLAQIVETAHFTAETAAKNIIADIDGGERQSIHSPKLTMVSLICIGSHYGVSNAGGMKTRGFIALGIKHLINMWYLFNIAGWNQVWEYLKHEFLDMKDKRSFIGNFVSYKIRPYWSVLLRMWLGLMWIFEGVNKIGEGWLAFSTGSKSGWMFSPGVIQRGVQAATEATSAASAAEGAAVAATSAASAAVSAGQAAATAATSAASAAAAAAPAATSAASAVAGGGAEAAAQATQVFKPVWDLTKPILDPNRGLVTWFRQTFMDGIFAHMHYSVFQTMVVVMEILIGLGLFGGTFTFLCAAASIGLCIVFTLSGMFAWNQVWFIFAGFLMLGGISGGGMGFWFEPSRKTEAQDFSRTDGPHQARPAARPAVRHGAGRLRLRHQ